MGGAARAGTGGLNMRIIVIGAGIVGLSSAEWLRRSGADVTLVDRVRPGDPAQASFGNAGLLARGAVVPNAEPGLFLSLPYLLLSPTSPFFLKWRRLPAALPWLARFLMSGRRAEAERIAAALSPLVEDTVEQHLALNEGTDARRFIQLGRWAYLYRDRRAFERDAYGWGLRRRNGVVWDEIGRKALLEEDPRLGPGLGFAAVMRDHGWLSDPAAYLAALSEHFERAGGRFRQGEVVDLRAPDGAVAGAATLAGGETLEADRIVLAGGAWSERLARKVGHRPSLESERGYHLMLHGADHKPPYPYMIAEAAAVATPMAAGLRLAGVMEIGGLEASASEAPVRLLERRARLLYPDLRYEKTTPWLGHRPGPPDSLPYIGESPKAPGVYFAFGAHHVGMTSGPKTGRLIADLVLGKELARRPHLDLTPYRVDRFD